MADPILWHKMSSGGNSEIGINPAVNLVSSYPVCRFGPGADIVGAWDVGFRFIDALTDTLRAKGSLSFFWQPHFSPDVGNIWHAFYEGMATSVYQNWTIYNHPAFPCKISWQLTHLGVGCGYVFSPNPWNAEDIIHLVFEWDNTADVGEKLKVFQDKVQIPVYSTAWGDTAWAIGGTPAELDFGYNTAGSWYTSAVIDNVKLYDYLLTQDQIAWDFANEGLYGAAPRRFFPLHMN